MAGYYRKFVKNYASKAKPLTKFLQNDLGQVSTHIAKKTEIQLDKEAIEAFNTLKAHLKSEVELNQPDYTKM